MNYQEIKKEWFVKCENLDLLNELKSLTDEKEVEDRFYKNLEFGTAGIRGVLGVGTNRMNVYTVGQVIQALVNKMKNNNEKKVVIGYDMRHKSKEFAELCASILSRNGIEVHIFEDLTATPILSYSVIKLKADAGIMITASHNPKEYNGLKLYSSDGTQIGEEEARVMAEYIKKVDIFEVDHCIDLKQINYVKDSLIEDYMRKATSVSAEPKNKDLNIVYTPLSGVGFAFIKKALEGKGYKNVHFVEEQINPDPDFSTVPSPNPENKESFSLAIKEGLKYNSDVLISTDPDADRVGVCVKHNGKYVLLSGNAVGTLLSHYIISKLYSENSLPENSKIIKSIVSDDLVEKVASRYNVSVSSVHVGFKNVYSLANKLEKEKSSNFIMGFEESLGYGIGTNLAKDKDAISAVVAILDMVSYYSTHNKTLVDVYREIQEIHGFHSNHLESFKLEGKDGLDKMRKLVDGFKNHPIAKIGYSKLTETIDYLKDDTGLEKQNVIKFSYDNGSWFVVRPSGTEPKLKFYMFSVGKTEKESKFNLEKMKKEITKKVK